MHDVIAQKGYRIIEGDCLDVLRSMPDESVQCCVTSPPYFGLRDYGTATWEGGDAACEHKGPPRMSDKTGLSHPELKSREQILAEPSRLVATPFRSECPKCGAVRVDAQIGLEATPAEFVAKMVDVFEEVRRVLKKDGTLWLNLGDSYAGSGKGGQSEEKRSANWQPVYPKVGETAREAAKTKFAGDDRLAGLKAKDLIGIPWRVAFALQEAGWWLRQDIIWHKPNPMPESVTDRCTKAHEYIFLLTKSAKYFYDAEAIKQPVAESTIGRRPVDFGGAKGRQYKADIAETDPNYRNGTEQWGRTFDYTESSINGCNKRSVWTVTTQPYSEAHFATFPPKLIEPCILAGSREGDLVLDPFCGSGTTGLVSLRHRRNFVGIELNPEYIKIAEKRLSDVQVKLF